MKHMRFLTLGILFAVALTGCAQPHSGKLRVVSTTGMINDIVQNIGGTHVESKALMGPGVDPHLYKASEGDVQALGEAQVIFYNGLHLEARMGEVLEGMSKRKKVVPVSQTIPSADLISPQNYQGLHDPHIWFDVSLWSKAAEVVRDTLIHMDPAHKADYEMRAKTYIASLQKLDGDVKVAVQSLPPERRILVTAHDAFGYFGRRYGMNVVGLQGVSTASEAGVQDVQRLAHLISERKIPAIFVESSIPERHIQAVQAATRARGWNVKIGGQLFTDAMGTPGTPEGTYVGMVGHNVRTMVSALAPSKMPGKP